ncbi:MAG: hypothetical protein KatS3mg111_4053 [Pirellulaceae bacterium]|nr:MAG: hypothetical protein KatS3mg111_4053 [Pirellulaceae bacterium]
MRRSVITRYCRSCFRIERHRLVELPMIIKVPLVVITMGLILRFPPARCLRCNQLHCL